MTAQPARVREAPPQLPAAQEFTVGQRAYLRGFLRQHPQPTSELSPANWLVWGHYPEWTEVDGHLLVRYEKTKGDRTRYLPPIGPNPAGLITRLVRSHGLVFDRVGEAIAIQVPTDNGIRVVAITDDHDYLYRRTDLQTMDLPVYQKHRGHMRKCLARQPVVYPLTPDRVPDCLAINQKWIDSKGEALLEDHVEDAAAAARMLEHFDALGLNGVIVYIDGQPEAYVIGEMYTDRVAVSHFEKAHLTRENRGLAHFAFNAWVTNLPAGCEFVNRMQDCGCETLRTWKESWGPCGRELKFRIYSA